MANVIYRSLQLKASHTGTTLLRIARIADLLKYVKSNWHYIEVSLVFLRIISCRTADGGGYLLFS